MFQIEFVTMLFTFCSIYLLFSLSVELCCNSIWVPCSFFSIFFSFVQCVIKFVNLHLFLMNFLFVHCKQMQINVKIDGGKWAVKVYFETGHFFSRKKDRKFFWIPFDLCIFDSNIPIESENWTHTVWWGKQRHAFEFFICVPFTFHPIRFVSIRTPWSE